MSKGKSKPRTVFLVQALDEVVDLGEKWQDTIGVFETLASAKREAWKKMSMQQRGPVEEQQEEEEGSGDDYDKRTGISRRVDDGPQKRPRSKRKEQEKKKEKKRDKEKVLPRGWKKDEDGELHWLYEPELTDHPCNTQVWIDEQSLRK